MLKPDQRIAVLFDDQLGEPNGKMGHGILRYAPNPVACVIDTRHHGKQLHDVIALGENCPVVASVKEAAALDAQVIILGMAPSGGRLPQRLYAEIDDAIAAGLSVVNGLHGQLAPRYPSLETSQWVWDIRREPQGIDIASARAGALDNVRVLTIGTDMAIGKMTVGLEMLAGAKRRGINSEFVATGQIGITICGRGIPLDAIRVDYACGAVEAAVLEVGDASLIIIEGQGSLAHPGSTSTLPLIRGSCPTHFVLCHRAGATRVDHAGTDIPIPPLPALITLYEDLSAVCGSYQRAVTVGVALNTHGLTPNDANSQVENISDLTGLPCADVVRDGADRLLDALPPLRQQ